MRHNFLLKLVFSLLLSGYFSVSYAATPVYLSSSGDDANDGLTALTAKATLSAAMTLVDAGGTIIVLGMVSATTETPLTKAVTIQGTSNTADGFTGGNSARFISNAGNNLTLSNLKLTLFNASTGNNGGVLLLSGGTVSISNVNFDNNKALLGGAIYATAGTITLDGCTIQNNDNTSISGSKGGAIYVLPTAAVNLNISNTLIKNNKTLTDGGALYYLDNAVTACAIKFTNCAIISNTTGGTTLGGAAFINNATASATVGITFINTTIYDNAAGGVSGGAMLVHNLRTGSVIDFRNCTLTGNRVLSGTTSAGGAGIRVLNTVHGANGGGVVKIYNSILENNYCTGALVSSINYTTDFVWQSEGFTAGTNLIIENSMLGRPMQASNAKWSLAENLFPTSKYNYVSVINSDVRNSYLAKFGTFNSTYNFLPLQSGSFALGYGVTSHLTGLTPSITTDQIGNARLGSNCDAGALEQSLKVTISSSTDATTSINPIPVTITFSNSVTGFDASDITVTNGTKGTLTGSGTTYTLDITPNAPGVVTVDIAANAATDIVGNGNVAATQFTRTYALAGTPPTVAISSTTSSTTQTNPIPITITFSELVSGFVVGDLTVSNGTAGNFAGGGATYTADITPTTQGIITVDIAADVAINGSSMGNTAATQFVRTYYKDIYLSTTGNDANDGFTPGTAVATFSAAFTKAIAGEKIYVSGMIDFSAETQPTGVTLNKNITIEGTSNATDGFDGKNLTRFFSIGNNNITLKNLKLKDGYSGNNNGGAIQVNTGSGSLTCENVIFDGNKTGMNTAFPSSNKTGAAIHFDNVNGATFKNCVFSNNEASKAGAVYFNSWAGTVLFESCAFVGNTAKESFGGSALFIRTTSSGALMNIVNSSFKGNHVNTAAANGGAINFGGRATNTTSVNIINCTVSENTTAGNSGNVAGIFMNNSDANLVAAFYIKNSIIEGNRTMSGAPADLSISAVSATSAGGSTGYMSIQNSIIGFVANPNNIPSGNIASSLHYNYLTPTSTSFDLKAGLATYNTTDNYFPLYNGCEAIGYGNSTLLTAVLPANTDQLGVSRGATNNAGSIQSAALVATTTPDAPTSIVATAGDTRIAVAFTTAATGGAIITNYKYSLNDGEYVACSPAKTTSPIVINGLTNTTAYTVKLKAVNANGDGAASEASNEETPDATANDIPVSTATNVSTLTLTPVSDIVVSVNVLTINQATVVNSITVSPGAKVSISGTNALTASNGIVLESNADATATILDNYTSPTVNATVQQYVTAGRNWYMSAPVSASGVGALSRGNSVVEWNEATKAWDTKSGGNLVAGRGYIQVANASQGTTGTVNFSGLTNSGTIAVAVSRTESGSSRGFNLVGNPYPSYIDWNNVIADSENTAAGLSTSFWYRTKNTLGAYVFTTYNGTSNEVVGGTIANTTINHLIPPMQAFWIKVNANAGNTTHSTTLKFKNTMREHGLGDNNKLKAPKADERLRLRLKLENGSVSDETLIYFDAQASDNFDNYDSPKMMNNSTTIPDLHTRAGAERLVINGLSELRDNMELPLGFSLNAAAALKFQVTELTNLPTEARIYLIDKTENTQTELVAQTAYSFSTTSATSNNESRFSLLFRAPGAATSIDTADKANTQVFVNAANQITIIAPEKSTYSIYNAVGMLIENGLVESKSETRNPKFITGVYIVKVNNSLTRVIIK